MAIVTTLEKCKRYVWCLNIPELYLLGCNGSVEWIAEPGQVEEVAGVCADDWNAYGNLPMPWQEGDD